MKKILVLNAGSSSIKYRVYGRYDDDLLESGLIEHISEETDVTHQWQLGSAELKSQNLKQRNVSDIFEYLFHWLEQRYEFVIVAHRVVHGGMEFSGPVKIDDVVLESIRQTIHLAPLHNPANLSGIELAMKHLPGTVQIAVFDTAFHHTLPERAFRYALPEEVVQRFHLRRFGFHGIAHHYLMNTVASHLNRKPESLNLITLHLGNGASIAAIRAGKCIDTSMGMTPLEGLVMGSRSGDVDPGIILTLLHAGYDVDSIDTMLNLQSGLKGICGSNDMRTILQKQQSGDIAAQSAVELFCYRIKKYIGAYVAILGQVDALVFSGGIGEHVWQIRQQCCQGLEHVGIQIDSARNQTVNASDYRLDDGNSAVAIFKIAANEELQIARLARSCVEN